MQRRLGITELSILLQGWNNIVLDVSWQRKHNSEKSLELEQLQDGDVSLFISILLPMRKTDEEDYRDTCFMPKLTMKGSRSGLCPTLYLRKAGVSG